MKCIEVLELLKALRPLGLDARVEHLYLVFEAAPETALSAVVKKRPKWEGCEDGPAVGAELVQILAPWANLLRAYGKPAVVKDLDLLISTLAKAPFTLATRDAWVASLLPRQRVTATADPARVQQYIERLEGNLGNEEHFAAIYRELKSDAAVTKADWNDLAKRFTGMAAKSKADALKRIWERHNALLVLGAKGASRDGRSAA